MTNSVPDRWLNYAAFGDVIKDTKILAFKVPLKDAISSNLKPEDRFTTTILREAFPQLKCIIDLTNTCRYYDGKEFTNVGIQYEKIAIPGRKVPPMSTIEQFFKVMDDFTSTSGEADLIGVHCTHGVNRTGYLICRYLIQQRGWKAQDTLKAFEEARGYPIERHVYLNALEEVQRGNKIDTSNIILMPRSPTNLAKFSMKNNSLKVQSSFKNQNRCNRSGIFSMSPPTFVPHRGFADGNWFSPQRFVGPPSGPPFGLVPPLHGMPPMPPPPSGPPFGPVPPLHGMPPMPPPPMGPSLYGPRPFRYGAPPIRSAMPPTAMPAFSHPGGFPSPRMAGPPSHLITRLPPAKIPPPIPSIPPPPPPSFHILTKSEAQQNRKHIRNNSTNCAMNAIQLRPDKIIPKIHNEQDFTVDTFEENLASSASGHPRRMKKQFSRI